MPGNPYEGRQYGYCGGGYGYCGTPASGAALLLDSVAAYAAWSLRKLSSVHTNAIRVRRDSDNAEQDIGFVNDVLDTASLLTFCGAGSGYIVTKYDATGNGRHWTQATTTRQTRIVNAGSIESIGGQPGERFVTGNVYGLTNSSLIATRFDVFAAWACIVADTYSIGYSNPAGSRYAMAMQQSSVISAFAGAGTPAIAKNGSIVSISTRDDAYSAFVTGATTLLRMQSLDTATWTGGVRDGLNSGTANFDGYRFEEIWFNSDATDHIDSIQASQATAYGVTLA